MPLPTIFSPELKAKLAKLLKRDRARYDMLMKKVEQIASSDEFTIQHYKNLRHDMSEEKRAHIDRSFVLTFAFNRQTKTVEFLDFDHHDKIYRR